MQSDHRVISVGVYEPREQPRLRSRNIKPTVWKESERHSKWEEMRRGTRHGRLTERLSELGIGRDQRRRPTTRPLGSLRHMALGFLRWFESLSLYYGVLRERSS